MGKLIAKTAAITLACIIAAALLLFGIFSLFFPSVMMSLTDSLGMEGPCASYTVSVYEKTGNVPRDVRFTLVETLKNELTEIIVLIYKANSTPDKLPHIERARDLIVSVKVRLRLRNDLRHINVKLYAQFSEQVESVSKQLASWQDYVRKNRNKTVQQS